MEGLIAHGSYYAIYLMDADISSPCYLAPEDLGYLYYGERGIPIEFDLVQDYCIAVSRSSGVKEIHIFKVKYLSNAAAIERMLERRKKTLLSPEINPGEADFFGTRPRECEVFHKGKYVFLIAGSNASEVKEKI